MVNLMIRFTFISWLLGVADIVGVHNVCVHGADNYCDFFSNKANYAGRSHKNAVMQGKYGNMRNFPRDCVTVDTYVSILHVHLHGPFRRICFYACERALVQVSTKCLI